MTLRQAFSGMLQLLAVFGFFGAAAFLIALPFIPALRFSVAQLLLEKPDLFAIGGIALFGAALLMTIGFLGVNRGRFLLLRMGGNLVAAIDTKILRQTIAPLLRKHFSRRMALNTVEVIGGKQIAVGLTLAAMNSKEQEKLLTEAQRHLQILLAERFGYREPFTVQVLKQ